MAKHYEFAMASATMLWLLIAPLALADHTRRLLIRPLPGGTAVCRNTISGPFFMADDKGVVCSTKHFDFRTGCCSAGEKHSCAKCNPRDSCCEGFEECVSCCMAPTSRPEERMKEVHRLRNDPNSPLWPDTFEYCRFTCRTHSSSTSHENAYIGPRHHCFSKLGKPLMDPPVPDGALEGIKVVLGEPGVSCEVACGKEDRACSPDHVKYINSCDALRNVVNCEAGCTAETATAITPYYVYPEAPKQNRPALCVVSKAAGSGDGEFSCSRGEQFNRRLCPCAGKTAGGSGSSDTGA